ncbi:photosystem reaction center subunit H [Sphingomonas sp. Leaf357]|uniref:PRC-barrel domain-containing protein n=1 Tax=Sphingomonas sp. Leaf357 TaxID=1736350 RepID=UPI0006F63FA0|nr:PRC-barrel domain-containing protein [Sphingomonas sp. Leaf357]KQS04271.1 photosystem reaction center subunit H [Sphingomonas sp. Leaf357]
MSSTAEPTQLLIQSNKTDTMPVRSRDGDKLGSVYAFMVNKRTGQAMYAVLTIGGFLGMGKAYYPLPFALLSFDPVADVFIVTIDRRVLEGGPSWAANPPVFDQAYADRVASYYGVGKEDLSLETLASDVPPPSGY